MVQKVKKPERQRDQTTSFYKDIGLLDNAKYLVQIFFFCRYSDEIHVIQIILKTI